MELTCPNVQAYSQWLSSLKPEEAAELALSFDSEDYKEALNKLGIDLVNCDKLQLLSLIRQHWASLSDDDLGLIVGGEKFVGKIVAAVTVPVVAGVAAGVVAGGVVGAGATVGYYGGTHQL